MYENSNGKINISFFLSFFVSVLLKWAENLKLYSGKKANFYVNPILWASLYWSITILVHGAFINIRMSILWRGSGFLCDNKLIYGCVYVTKKSAMSCCVQSSYYEYFEDYLLWQNEFNLQTRKKITLTVSDFLY